MTSVPSPRFAMPKWVQWAALAIAALVLMFAGGRIGTLRRSRRALLAENRALERKLTAAKAAGEEWKRQLEHSDRLAFLGMTTAHVAHEINNPLLFVSLNLPRIRSLVPEVTSGAKGEARGELLEALADVEVGVERIRRIAEDLKAFSRRHDPGPDVVDLADIARSAVAMVSPLFPGRARIEERFEGSLPRLLGSRIRLMQVVVNLVRNALEAFPPGRTRNIVRVLTRTTSSGGAMLVVEDDGPGIPPEYRDRIFEPFFSTKPATIGTGLGLSICREIVLSHGGSIAVEHPKAGGTRFVVTLPAAEPRLLAAGDPS